MPLRKNPALAAGQFEQAVKLDPNLRAAYLNLGNALEDAGRITDSLWEFDAAIARFPRDANLYEGRANVEAQNHND